MKKEDLLEIFYVNLKEELNNDKFVDSIESLINKNRFSKNNYLKLLNEEYHE